MTPHVGTTADDFRDRVDLVEIDVATAPDQVGEHGVRAVPTLVAVHNGAVVGRAVGAQSATALAARLAGAAAGKVDSIPLSTTERTMRLGAAAAVGVIAILAGQPLLLIAAVGLGVFAFWDRSPPEPSSKPQAWQHEHRRERGTHPTHRAEPAMCGVFRSARGD